MMKLLSKIFGDANERAIAELRTVAEQVNAHEAAMQALSDEALRAKTEEFRARHTGGETLDALLPEAFAVVRETARRVLGQRHYDVQLMGGVVLHRGQIAEMRTGEGKTLTSTLPVYLNAIAGTGVHVVTVNDYLARRDAAWMGRIFDFLGMRVGIIQNQQVSFVFDPTFESTQPEDAGLRPSSRQESYQCDITYGTNNEFGFDYLRDNMVQDTAHMVQRPFSFAIVDELDSILIDEARTPLIISAPAADASDEYYKYAALAAKLTPEEDFKVDEKLRAATFTDGGIAKMEQWLGIENLYADGGTRAAHFAESALKARALFRRDKEYVVREGEIVIVDENTGRMMFGRRYNQGLHQAIEAKEGVRIQQESQTLGTVTFQNYFRLYPKLGGMTGTAMTEAEEFHKIYKLEVVVIPTHRDNIRIDHQDLIFKTEEAKIHAVIADIKARHEKGQPVLIGTISIEKNEVLSLLLEQQGVPHQMLNAKNHQREAEIIAQAGRRGAVTLATNMAGRGVDIILGGTPPDVEEARAVRELGGLYVVGTERHESRRIDNQLRGRAGRQGDPGETQFYVSTEDDLMRIFAGDRMKTMMERLKLPDDTPISHPFISKALENAQKKVEGNNFDTRKHLLEYDDVLNTHREVFYRRRREVLTAAQTSTESLDTLVQSMMRDEIRATVEEYTRSEQAHEWDRESLTTALHQLESSADALVDAAWDNPTQTPEGVREQVREQVEDRVLTRHRALVASMEPVALRDMERSILLRAMDSLWIEHLEAVDQLRTGIGLQGYGQRDPLVEYRRETHRLFTMLMRLIRRDSVLALAQVRGAVQSYQGMLETRQVQLSGAAKTMQETPTSSADGQLMESTLGAAQIAVSSLSPVEAGDKQGRNEPCHCGSGKKFKKCHGA